MKYKIAIPLVVVLSTTAYFVSANSGNMKKISRSIHTIQDVCEDVHLYMAEHTEPENNIYTQKLALDIEKYMKKLAENYKKLNSTDSIQIPLRAYLDTWTTEKIHQSLLVSDGKFLSDTGYLSSLFPSKKRWKTLFPIFKP